VNIHCVHGDPVHPVARVEFVAEGVPVMLYHQTCKELYCTDVEDI